eukprot:Phypoly_transcript_10208.p1 GENE.Phypoly_transcript_10208~~Phypoly_transcript_10208.p1  ORF type:complete len:377 (+),score=22.30 Phypoly_transcript_10208:114-1244(+)
MKMSAVNMLLVSVICLFILGVRGTFVVTTNNALMNATVVCDNIAPYYDIYGYEDYENPAAYISCNFTVHSLKNYTGASVYLYTCPQGNWPLYGPHPGEDPWSTYACISDNEECTISTWPTGTTPSLSCVYGLPTDSWHPLPDVEEMQLIYVKDNLVLFMQSIVNFTLANSCMQGQYQVGALCKNCSVGTYGPGYTKSCTTCPKGTTGTEEGQRYCTPCPVGTYGPGGASPCTPCAPGYYGGGNSACTSAPPGYYSPGGVYRSTECPAGTYSNTHGAVSCTPCPNGTISCAGATSCSHCPAGKIADDSHTLCFPCPPGTYGLANANECTPCPPRAYSQELGSSSPSTCIVCSTFLLPGCVHSPRCCVPCSLDECYEM